MKLSFLVAFVLSISAVLAQSDELPLIKEGATLQKLSGEFKFTEGPISDKAGNVYFTDQPNDRIMVWGVDGILSTFMQPSGRANGMYFDHKGNLWVCADEKNELWIIDKNKKVTVVLNKYQEKLLNGPNDLWILPNGSAYFTDPFYDRPWWEHHEKPQDIQAVYYLPKNRKTLKRVATDLKQPNGIVGTPDGKNLYVADIGGSKTYRYDINKNGDLTNRMLFCEMGSDGMTLDNRGNLYLTNRAGVTAFSPDGKQILNIPTGEGWTANVCFGGKDHSTLFVTASKGLYAIEMNVKGVNP